jgi:glycosyltransferase involved in cell wall biosynthesis
VEVGLAKVLWLGDAGCHTGFARVTHAIGDRLVDKGHDIHCLATNYQGDHFATKVKLYRPTKLLQNDFYGKSRIIEMLGNVEPDVVVVLNDPALISNLLFDNGYDKDRYLLQYRPLIAYMPIDGHNPPPGWKILNKVTKPVAMTKFGRDAFMEPDAPVVYHGVDTDVFYPVSKERPIYTSTGLTVTSKREAKAAFQYPEDSFLILRVDRNSGRKDYPASWKALVPVMRRHRDIIVHFHCQGMGDTMGVDIRALKSRDPDTSNRFFLPDLLNTFIGWDEADLNCLYNAADLFISTSRGEGFGLTIAEAMSVGLPVIAQNVSAIPEVVGPGGQLIDPQREITVPSGQDQWLADIEAFAEAIEHAYLSAGWRRDRGRAGRDHIIKSFSWDYAADRFDEYIAELKEGVDAAFAQQQPSAVGA